MKLSQICQQHTLKTVGTISQSAFASYANSLLIGESSLRKDQVRQLRKIAKIGPGNRYKLIGFYLTGSLKTFKTKSEALKYGKLKGWKISNPLKV